MLTKKNLIKISDYLWEIPKSYRSDMRVPARVYASEEMLEAILCDRSLDQLVNVATLPGIQEHALAMPDAHEGYGFPIGGVAAMFYPNGVISPGGIGYDINCGVRLLKSRLDFNDIAEHLNELADEIYLAIPSGVGRGGKIKLSQSVINQVLKDGAKWAVRNGYGEMSDLARIESEGSLSEAKPDKVSEQAKKRGKDQLGTLGAGNHFLEISRVQELFDEKTARQLGLKINQIVILIHSGSRGLGHQVATDYIRVMNKAMPNYNIETPDRELVCAPFSSKEGQDYFAAMSAAANFAWANRQLMTWSMREVFDKIFGRQGELEIVCDVAHNIAKIEEHQLTTNNRQISTLVVHRKGATRAFPGQPVIIPGSMGTASYVLIGTEIAMKETFGSVCHGAGRAMSRQAAAKSLSGEKLKRELKEKEGIFIRVGSVRGLAEEAPAAYKNIDEVVNIVQEAGLAQKVAKLKPLAVIKG